MIPLSSYNSENEKTLKNINLEQVNQDNNSIIVLDGNKISTSFKKPKTFIESYDYLDELIVDDNEKYYYKQWEVKLFEGSTSDINYIINLFGANLSYNIFYRMSNTNILDFYNTGMELREVSFLTVYNTSIYLYVSVFISKVFGGEEIVNPEAQLEITIKPFLHVAN